MADKRSRPGSKDRSADGPDDDDAQLFRRAVSDARPIEVDFVQPPRRVIPRRAQFSRLDEEQVLHESLLADTEETDAGSGDNLQFRRPSVGHRDFRKLIRGKFSIQDELDLHGMTVAEAREALGRFLEAAQSRDLTCVRIVHGKGLGSGHAGPILKRKVDGWLRRWDGVLAFASTRQVDGGTGALYVLLKKY